MCWGRLVVLTGFLLFTGALSHDIKPKEYKVDLDLAPEERWISVLENRPNFREEINQVIKLVLSRVPEEFRTLVMVVMKEIVDWLPPTYMAEIKGIAKYANISAADIVLGNVLYDYTAACTSIVAEDVHGHIWHGRNLDYDFTDFLRNTTIVVHFHRNGKVVYSGTTYVSMVGVLTGQKPHVFTISMDERNQGDYWMNILTALLDKKSKHAVFLIRDLLEEAETYDDMVEVLQDTDTIAPAYYIVGGTRPGQGAVITRGRLRTVDTWVLDAPSRRWYLVETNYDHWKLPPPHDDRRHPAMKYMNAVGQSYVNSTTIYSVLSKPPLLRPTTTYTTVMSAAYPEAYSTRVRYYKP